MATILAHIKVHPGTAERFETIARELYAATHREEDDVLRYEYWRGADPDSFYTLLAFPDEHAFLDHQVSEHHEVASPALGEVLADIRLEWVDPVDGACALPPTASMPPRSDASELWLSYHERMGARVADWWQPLRSA